MKKISLMFIAFIFISECFGQSSSKEVIYGTIRADGYQKITKGAMWAIRPEAKAIYEGTHPEGYTVVVLDQDYFVRFVDGENNQFDRNYIVFPKGSVVYTNDRTNQFYSAICGNKIEYIRPVNLVIVKTIIEEKEKPNVQKLLREYKPSSDIDLGLTNTNIKTKTWFGKNWLYLAAGATLVGGIIVGERNDWWRKSSEGSTFKSGGAPVPQGFTFSFSL